MGKSTILNLIAENTPTSDLCTQILHSHELPSEIPFEENDMAAPEIQMETLDFVGTTESRQEKTEKKFKFKMQDIEQIERGINCTKGKFFKVKNYTFLYFTSSMSIIVEV